LILYTTINVLEMVEAMKSFMLAAMRSYVNTVHVSVNVLHFKTHCDWLYNFSKPTGIECVAF